MWNMVSMSRICCSIPWNALRGLMVAGKAVAVICKGGFEYLSMRAKYVLQPVQSLLQFSTIPSSQTGLLPLFILADGAIAGAPTTGRLASITFHLEELDAVQ
jgi:hypothetical protein